MATHMSFEREPTIEFDKHGLPLPPSETKKKISSVPSKKKTTTYEDPLRRTLKEVKIVPYKPKPISVKGSTQPQPLLTSVKLEDPLRRTLKEVKVEPYKPTPTCELGSPQPFLTDVKVKDPLVKKYDVIASTHSNVRQNRNRNQNRKQDSHEQEKTGTPVLRVFQIPLQPKPKSYTHIQENLNF